MQLVVDREVYVGLQYVFFMIQCGELGNEFVWQFVEEVFEVCVCFLSKQMQRVEEVEFDVVLDLFEVLVDLLFDLWCDDCLCFFELFFDFEQKLVCFGKEVGGVVFVEVMMFFEIGLLVVFGQGVCCEYGIVIDWDEEVQICVDGGGEV